MDRPKYHIRCVIPLAPPPNWFFRWSNTLPQVGETIFFKKNYYEIVNVNSDNSEVRNWYGQETVVVVLKPKNDADKRFDAIISYSRGEKLT